MAKFIATTTSKSATRDFILSIDPIIFRPSESSTPGITSIKVGTGIYFHSSSTFKVPASKVEHEKLVGYMADYITKLVEKEAQRLMKFWYDNVNMYFNRRAYGVSHHAGAYRNKRRQQLGRVKTAYIANSRQHTGQLRKAITLRKVNIYGAELYVRHVYAKTNNVDYVDILMRGASRKRGAYIPSFDLRIKRGIWGGIPSVYWLAWQTRFQKEIKNSEMKLQRQIESFIEKRKVLNTKQIRAARNNRYNKEFINTIKGETRNFSIEFKKPKYADNRGLDPYNEPYDEKQTWQGMRELWISKQPIQGSLSWMIRQAEKRRNFGR